MGRRWGRVAAVLILCLVAVASELPAQNWIGWTEAEVDGVTFLSEAEPPRTRELAASFLQFRLALRTLAPDAVHRAPVPTQIFIFSDEASYRVYKLVLGRQTRHLVGHFTSSTFGDWIAVNGDPAVGNPLRAIYHEATHAFTAHNFPNVPLWLNEGLAEYYSTFRREGERVAVGHPVEQHLRVLAEAGLMPIRTLFEVDTRSPHYQESERSGQFYAQSWLLTHYLLSRGNQDAGAVQRFLDLLADGKGSEQAFEGAFGLSFGQVEKELDAYSRRSEYDYWSVPGEAETTPPKLRLVSANWVRYRLGTYLALTRPDFALAARRRLEPAAEGGVPDAWATLAYLAEREDDFERAEQWYEKSVAEGAREALSYTLYGRFLLRISEPGSDGALWAREMLDQAITLDPGFVEPRALYGSSFLLTEPTEVEDGILQLREAWSRLPGRLDIPFNLAMLFLRVGDEASAERIIERVEAAGDEELGQKGRAAIEEAREVRRYRVLTAEYNKAVEQINEGNYRAAEYGLRRLLEQDLPEELIDVVERTMQQLGDAPP